MPEHYSNPLKVKKRGRQKRLGMTGRSARSKQSRADAKAIQHRLSIEEKFGIVRGGMK